MEQKDKHLLTRSEDRISFVYIEMARIEQTEYSVQIIQGKQFAEIPITTINCLILGPGCSITHRAIGNIAQAGCTVCWMGEQASVFYVYGEPATRHSKNILTQMRYHEDKNLHLKIVHRMYEIRYPEKKLKTKTLEQLRGVEGLAVRELYAALSEKYNVPWTGRQYQVDDFNGQDEVNKTLTSLNQLLYAIIHAMLVTMGYSPAIGYVHTGNMLSFVYDVADLYKEKLTIPLAFELASQHPYDRKKTMRAFRDRLVELDLMSSIVKDIKTLFADASIYVSTPEATLELWNGYNFVNSGKNYSENPKNH